MYCEHICVVNSKQYAFSGCMNDIRYNEEWLPMDQSQNSESRAAEVMRYQYIIDGCKSEMCLQLMCSPPLICVDLWRYAECRFDFL